MKNMQKLTRVALMILLMAALMSLQLNGQSRSQAYTVIDLGTLGGTLSSAEGISNKGWVAGYSTLPGDTITHASLWQNDVIIDLGMPGLNSLIAYPFNERGEVAIHSEVSAPDPLGEDFCGFGTHLACPPFLWKRGSLIQLPTLGGGNGHTSQVNNRGAAAGVAENATTDLTCIPQECVEQICPSQVLQTKPVLWKGRQIQELPTFAGDSDGGALVINDSGQVAGTSGKCIGSAEEARHALLWEHGTLTDLGNLGGTMNHHPQYINNRGQVVGYSNLAGDETTHAFLWQKGLMTDLGTLLGDFSSFAEAVNDNGEIGGFSCDAGFNCRAFVWQNGAMTDVNTLIPSGSALFLLDILSINSRGEIVGDALEISTGEAHGYLAIPARNETLSDATLPEPGGDASRVQKLTIPGEVRMLLRRRLGRYHVPDSN
jgi:probable HAF family extracellular repeat protein